MIFAQSCYGSGHTTLPYLLIFKCAPPWKRQRFYIFLAGKFTGPWICVGDILLHNCTLWSCEFPFRLYATLHHYLQQYNNPLSNDTKTNLYVNNIISGRATEAETVHGARAILSDAGFNLRAWMSNSQWLYAITNQLSLIPIETDPTTNKLTTKREVLQESSRVFKPIGFATPVTIHSINSWCRSSERYKLNGLNPWRLKMDEHSEEYVPAAKYFHWQEIHSGNILKLSCILSQMPVRRLMMLWHSSIPVVMCHMSWPNPMLLHWKPKPCCNWCTNN